MLTNHKQDVESHQYLQAPVRMAAVRGGQVGKPRHAELAVEVAGSRRSRQALSGWIVKDRGTPLNTAQGSVVDADTNGGYWIRQVELVEACLAGERLTASCPESIHSNHDLSRLQARARAFLAMAGLTLETQHYAV
eukprot:s123_g34.t1